MLCIIIIYYYMLKCDLDYMQTGDYFGIFLSVLALKRIFLLENDVTRNHPPTLGCTRGL